MDKLTICPRCGNQAAYEESINSKIKNHQCLSCGFLSNTLMKLGEDFLKEQLDKLPELYKDLVFEDKNHQFWIPSTVNIPDKGMVFANGKNKNHWGWSAARAIKDEKGEWKMDHEDMKHFDELHYLKALQYIGVDFS